MPGGRWRIRFCYCLVSGPSWCPDSFALQIPSAKPCSWGCNLQQTLCGWVSSQQSDANPEQSQQLCFPKDDTKIKQIIAKNYFSTWNLEVVRNMELQLLFCPALSHTIKRRSPGSFCCRRGYCSESGSCKKVIRWMNFFTENGFIFLTWRILLFLRAGPVRRHKLCKSHRPSLKNSYPHLTFLFSPLRDLFQGINNLVICESIGQTQPLCGLVSFWHPQQMNRCQHLSQGLQWVQQRSTAKVS